VAPAPSAIGGRGGIFFDMLRKAVFGLNFPQDGLFSFCCLPFLTGKCEKVVPLGACEALFFDTGKPL